MKKIYIISLTALLLFGAAGCKKDFLEVRPTGFLTADQVAQAAEHNPAVVAGSIAGIYTLMF
ncbi:MAG: RagB/SusD family nutrient uptake outer membrane protein, partial [Bacteroidota bacterium]